MTYQPRRPPVRHSIELRSLPFSLYEWPAESDPPAATLVMLHGWLDSGETFQFLADHFDARYRLLALDQRGFGRSGWARAGYWFPDYLADVDALLERFVPDQAIALLGHSMGGNVASLYAGVRPQRVRHLLNLEGFGLAPTQASQSVAHYRKWLDQLQTTQTFPTYPSWAAFTEVLLKRNSRLAPDYAEFIAHAWGQLQEDGRVGLRADPAHRRVNPVLYRIQEAQACWQAITADVLFIIGKESDLVQQVGFPDINAQIERYFPKARVDYLADTGHMMQHERPGDVAASIAHFLQESAPRK
jgi:pimeloyl-ACP methyl ester carboxylesterase